MQIGALLKTKAHQGAITAKPEATVDEVIQLMCHHGVGSVVIADGEGLPVGIFTERDVLRLYAQGHRDFTEVSIRRHMTTHLVTGNPTDSLDDALNTMTQKRFRHLPVLEDNRLVGLVSIGDLVKAKLQETAQEAQALREYISA
ncbi:MAG: CBS domain-containing protein [Candidatus Competibacterales bacterium]